MAGSTDENLLLIFAKNPERGRVKTRLAESVGEGKALRVYQQLLQITKSVTDQLNCSRQIWYSDFINEEDLWSTGGYEKHLQEGSNLGERMKEAFKQAFAGDYEKAVIIGSDCAALTTALVEDAFRLLDDNDIVVGPSKDGGYYLLCMSSFYPRLFNDISWSTSEVLEQTLNQISELELSFKLLPELNDIDTIRDLKASEMDIKLS